MTLRDTRQEEFAKVFMDTDQSGILYLCPRFGKCRVALKCFSGFQNILVAYPDKKIKESWVSEMNEVETHLEKERSQNGPKVHFVTHRSMHKHLEGEWDLVVMDEIHLLSSAQLDVMSRFKEKTRILGLTGTLSDWTERNLKRLGLPVLARYPIETAIEEGIISDYEIIVKTVSLNSKKYQKIGKKYKTEKQAFDDYSFIIEKKRKETKGKFNDMFLKLNRMRIIQNSIAKLAVTQQLLQQFKDERILVFCGLTKIADKVGCPVYHSKKGEVEVFNNFASGEGNHLAVVKIGNTGVTYKPLNRVIINYFDSNAENLAQKINRCMAMEYDNPDKKALIYIISSSEVVELQWLKKALEFFDPKKIRYE